MTQFFLSRDSLESIKDIDSISKHSGPSAIGAPGEMEWQQQTAECERWWMTHLITNLQIRLSGYEKERYQNIWTEL